MGNVKIDTDIPRPDGLELASFVGLRYDPSRVDLARVIAPPYDVITPAERDALLRSDPHNVVALTLPSPDPAGYDGAASRLHQWRDEGVLVADADMLYVYEQTVGDHVQRGLLGALALTPAEDRIVLPHENTMAGPVADRLALTAATQTNLEPIFCVYDGGGAASRAVRAVDRAAPLLDFTAADHDRHRLWGITDPGELSAIAVDLHGRKATIADGHHRYATYLRHQADQHAAGHGAGPWDRGLALLVDAGSFGPRVLAIHRVVPSLPIERAVQLASDAFTVREVTTTAALEQEPAPAFIISDGNQSWLLTDPDPAQLAACLPVERSAAWRGLDVTIAHRLLFDRVWALDDREGVVDFAHDEAAALAAASAAGGTALLLKPTPVAAVAAVAAAGERMPRKSTLFLPKPATGIVLRSFVDQVGVG